MLLEAGQDEVGGGRPDKQLYDGTMNSLHNKYGSFAAWLSSRPATMWFLFALFGLSIMARAKAAQVSAYLQPLLRLHMHECRGFDLFK
jgi:hypothetical protein